MNESGFSLDPKSPFFACMKGEHHPAFITSGGKTQITVLACYNPSSLCEKTWIKYILLYSLFPKFQRSIQHSADVTFSKEEVCRYERRYEEDYDIPDEKYEQCLKLHHTHPRESTPAND